jgi:hypothetical protein
MIDRLVQRRALDLPEFLERGGRTRGVRQKQRLWRRPSWLYYVPCEPSPDAAVHVMDPDTGRDRRLGALENLMSRPLDLSVSPDGNTIVYPKRVQTGADVMLIENFR